MGNYNPNYFDRKSGSLERAVLDAVNGVRTQIDEKVTEYIELEFKDKQAAINAYKTINNKVYPGGTQPFEDINQEGNSIQLDKVDDAKKVLADFKKVGRLQFKVAVEESVTKEGTKEEYKKFFDAAMKKFGIDSPADLKSDEEKKKFFDYVDKNYKGEKDEAYHAKIKEWSGVKESYEIGTSEYTNHTKKITPGQGEADWNETVVNIHKKQTSMREALAKMWGIDEGKSPFGEKEEVKPKKEGKTLTGKPMTKVDVNPDIKEK
jgi:hypothetical protein